MEKQIDIPGLLQAMLNVLRNSDTWAYQFCDFESFCRYDESGILEQYTEEEAMPIIMEGLGLVSYEYEGITYYSCSDMTQQELKNIIKQAVNNGDL